MKRTQKEKESYREAQKSRMRMCLANLRLLTGLTNEEFVSVFDLDMEYIGKLESGAAKLSNALYLAFRSVFVDLSKDNKHLRRAMHEVLNADKTSGEVYAAVMTITGLVRCGIQNEETIDRLIDDALGEGYEDPKDTLEDWI